MPRLLYPKDLMRIKGLPVRSQRSASRLHKRVRDLLGKRRGQPITPKELADYLGVGEDSLLF